MALVNIDNDTLLKMLIDRLQFWTDDNITIELFAKMYSNYLNDRLFNNIDFDINKIVDNDFINNCIVVYKSNIEDYSNYTIESSTDDNNYYLIRY
ncbi:hypothetical protein [uncultured Megamonas sp.]|uniref:hypothetical protein n=1 Tax=uncultured Megamonas sp. TaxID=286140 RepID=UPI00259BF16F|nr:hypothetical protein [uncultured Megamonas sp.]